MRQLVEKMNPLLIKFRNQLDSAPLVVRIVVFAFLFIVIYLIWNYNFWQENRAAKAKVLQQIQAANTEIQNLQAQLKTLEIELKTKQTKAAAAEISAPKPSPENQPKLISPTEMRTVLENLLTTKFKLSLIEFKTLPLKIATTSQTGSAQLFEHDMLIRFRGDYFTVVKYLKAIEDLKWKILWDRLEYKVIKYPTAEITLQIHSLSAQEDWINA